MTHGKNYRRVAVVTGGSGYVGSAIIREFERYGWAVADLSRNSTKFPCDITDKRGVHEAINKIIAAHGAISACVHAAARENSASAEAIMAVAVLGGEYLAEAALPHMAEGGAFIGITTQLLEREMNPGALDAYLLSKVKLREFLRELERRAHKIRVYAVAPGYLPGGLNKDVPRALVEFLARKTSKDPHSVEDVAQLVVRIADKPVFPSGTSILVDGEVVTPL